MVSVASAFASPPNHLAAPQVGDARQRINLAWLIRLRWGAVICQSITVAAVMAVWHVKLSLPPLLAVLMLTTTTNLVLMQWAKQARTITALLIGLVVMLDIIMLTALLYFTGGSTNPFNFLYLVHIALAAVILSARWIAGLLLLAFICFGSLFWWYVPLSVGSAPALPVRLHGQGMAVAFVLAAAFIVYFVNRVSSELSAREIELARARELTARSERLSSLATLAAGAAHELATPLATIAIVAKELERHLAQLPQGVQQGQGLAAAPDAVHPAVLVPGAQPIATAGPTAGTGPMPIGPLREDARLIRHEVERCRAVLTHMAADAGAGVGEPPSSISTADLLELMLADVPQRQQVQLDWQPGAAQAKLLVPSRSVAQAMRCVVKNALEASLQAPLPDHAADSAVTVRVLLLEQMVHFQVIDQGTGMSPETLAHVGEPFFTTKPPGLGMGLGLFLTRTVFEGLGGQLRVHSVANCGTTITLTLPSEAAPD
jgi:two-component system sensor histidine kinase RegB